jgi:hypothetical protein
MWVVCFVYCRKPKVPAEVERLGRQSIINFSVALALLLGWYIYFAVMWEELGAFGEAMIVINPKTYWFTAV